MKITIKQLRNLIKEAVSEFSSKQEFDSKLAAAEQRAHQAYMHFQHADNWPSAAAKNKEEQAVKSTAAEVERLKKLGDKMGWASTTTSPQLTKTPTFVRGSLEERWLQLMQRFPNKADVLADRWDALVKEAPQTWKPGRLQKMDPKLGKVVGWGTSQLVQEITEELGTTDEHTRLDIHHIVDSMTDYRWEGTTTTGFDLLAAMNE